MNHEEEQRKPTRDSWVRMGAGIAVGAGIGAALGVAMENMGAGLAIGIAMGAGIGTIFSRQQRNERE
jgi:uncharacterized membrane protein